MEIQEIEIKYDFSEEEITKIGREIARLSQDIGEKEDEKKAAMSDFKSQIDAIKKVFNDNINRVNNGYEMRKVEARLSKNYFTNEREYYDPITGDLLKREPFEPSDLQRHLDEEVNQFEQKAKPKERPVIDENGQPEPPKEETPEPEGFGRLEYNEKEQMFHLDDARFSRAGREHSANWKIISSSEKLETMTNFRWLFPNLNGSFVEVRGAYLNYLIKLEETEALNEAAEKTETSDEKAEQKPAKKKKPKYVVKSKRQNPPTE